jgi:hypothetical protein
MPQRKSTVSGEKPLNIGQVSFQLAGGVAVILDLKFVTGAGIDNGGISMGVDSFHGVVIAFVDMAVDPVPGVVSVDKLPEAFKALVSRVGKVTVACNGGVGKDDIHTAILFQPLFKLADALAHLPFGVLMRTGAILQAAAQAQNPQTLANHDFILYIVAAQRGFYLVAFIVIAVDI